MNTFTVQETINISQSGICFTPIEWLQVREQIMQGANDALIAGLIIGFILGFAMPRIAAYIRVKYGRSSK